MSSTRPFPRCRTILIVGADNLRTPSRTASPGGRVPTPAHQANPQAPSPHPDRHDRTPHAAPQPTRAPSGSFAASSTWPDPPRSVELPGHELHHRTRGRFQIIGNEPQQPQRSHLQAASQPRRRTITSPHQLKIRRTQQKAPVQVLSADHSRKANEGLTISIAQEPTTLHSHHPKTGTLQAGPTPNRIHHSQHSHHHSPHNRPLHFVHLMAGPLVGACLTVLSGTGAMSDWRRVVARIWAVGLGA